MVDDPARLAAQLSAAAASCDVVISTGGVSVGDADHMPRLVGEAGGALSIVKVAMKPGKPVTVGELGATIYVGLPGNPVAAFITYLLIARPIIERCARLVVSADGGVLAPLRGSPAGTIPGGGNTCRWHNAASIAQASPCSISSGTAVRRLSCRWHKLQALASSNRAGPRSSPAWR